MGGWNKKNKNDTKPPPSPPPPPPPPRDWAVTVHLSMPLFDHGYKEVDPASSAIKDMFSLLEEEYDAEIRPEVYNEDVAITIKTMNRPNAKAVIDSLKRQLRSIPGEESVWHPHVLIHPPSVGKDQFKATLSPMEIGSTKGKRIIPMGTPNLLDVDDGDVATAKIAYKQALEKTLDQVGAVLRGVNTGMAMKISFGTLLLTAWPKGKEEYNFAELENMASPGGKAKFEFKHQVNEAAARKLVGLLKSKNGLPESVQDFMENSAEQKFFIIFETKNLRAESELTYFDGQKAFQGAAKGPRTFVPGAVQETPLEKRNRVVEIITACPEMRHDWAVEILNKEAQNTTHIATLKAPDLQKNIKFTGQQLPHGFPVLTINNRFLSANNISKVEGKTQFRYTLNSRYEIAVDVLQEWDLSAITKATNGVSAAKPGIKATVSLFSPDWELEDMRAGDEVPRNWDDSFGKQFFGPKMNGDEAPEPVPGTTKDPVAFLMLWVEWILRALEG